ncbi:MAG TPA: type II CAAX endopeptidase family protein [Xanthobacteraceae bacterium]|nr:type II CAAX endopeptidase family protein [Xanthobacteraceae bacterium]
MSEAKVATDVGDARPTTWITLGRTILFAVALIALYVALQGLTGFVLHWAGPSARLPTLLAMELVTCAVMVIAYRALVRLVERRGASELAFDASTAFASRGALFGAALFCAVYAVLWASGSAHYLGFDGLGGVLFAFGISIAAAFGEEIIVRGGIFRVIEEGFGTLVAVIFSASLFGALHAVNNGATLVSTVSIGLEAGVLLGLAYTATRSLWFPIGIHFGWNFTEGGIFGATVSGFKMPGVLNFPLSGPELLTGGSFGPEASVVAVVVCLLGSAWVARWAIRSGRWKRA